MGKVVTYNTGTNRVTAYIPSANSAAYVGQPGTLVEYQGNTISGLSGLLSGNVPPSDWMHDAGSVREMTAPEKVTRDGEIAASSTTAMRAGGATIVTAAYDHGILFRALVKLIVSELNILRNLHSLANRTEAQVRTAIINEINSGTVDS